MDGGGERMTTQYPNAIDSYAVHQDNVNEKVAAAVLNNLQDAMVAVENRLGVAGLTSMPAVGPADSFTIVNHQLYISNGTTWNPVSTSLPGTDALEVQLTSTSATTVASFTPTASKMFLVAVYLRVVTAATNVTVNVTYNDAGGSVTNPLFPTQSLGVQSWSLPICPVNAVSGTPIVVSVTAGTANQVYASASVVGV